MSILSRIIGIDPTNNSTRQVGVHRHGGQNGLVAFTDDLIKRDFFIQPLLNDTFGAQMAQDVTFGGAAVNIHDGGDNSGWTGAAVSGTWNFADSTAEQTGTNGISITGANNLDTATFISAGETDMSARTAITGGVNLITYNDTNHGMTVVFRNNGVLVGNSVDIEDYIDSSLLGTYQNFVIPKDDMGLNGFTVDEFDIVITRSGGAKPTIHFDNIQIEETGEPIVFTLAPQGGKRILLERFILAYVDNIDLTVTNGTVAGLSYDKLMGLTKLPNGITVRTQIAGETFFAAVITSIGDSLKGGASISSPISDGTNSCVTIAIEFLEPVVLDGGRDDLVSFTINDDLSGLISFTTLAVGRTEDI